MVLNFLLLTTVLIFFMMVRYWDGLPKILSWRCLWCFSSLNIMMWVIRGSYRKSWATFFFLHANWEQQTKESAVVDGISCCVILECPVTSIACIAWPVSRLTKWPTTICRFASVLSANSLWRRKSLLQKFTRDFSVLMEVCAWVRAVVEDGWNILKMGERRQFRKQCVSVFGWLFHCNNPCTNAPSCYVIRTFTCLVILYQYICNLTPDWGFHNKFCTMATYLAQFLYFTTKIKIHFVIYLKWNTLVWHKLT